MNCADEDVKKYLCLFTLLDLDKIQHIVDQHMLDSSARYGQEILAYEVTSIIFGRGYADQCRSIREVLYAGDSLDKIAAISGDLREMLLSAVTSVALDMKSIADSSVIDILCESGLAASRKMAKQDITSGAIYINDQKMTDISRTLMVEDVLDSRIIHIRKGKKNMLLVDCV